MAYELSDGDAFVLITDGFFKWAHASGEQFGMGRLRGSLARHGERSGQTLIRAVLGDVERFTGGTP